MTTWAMFMAGVAVGLIAGVNLADYWLKRALRRFVRELEGAPTQALRDMAPVARDAFEL